MTPHHAREIASRFGLWSRDFHTLSASEAYDLAEAAKAYKYRKPKNANGSTARYFAAYLIRLGKRADGGGRYGSVSSSRSD